MPPGTGARRDPRAPFPNSRLTSSGTSRDRNEAATSSAASATPCSRAVNFPPSRTSGAPPC
jgi:hypothetical protein